MNVPLTDPLFSTRPQEEETWSDHWLAAHRASSQLDYLSKTIIHPTR